MIKINDKILTNKEVIELLEKETGSGKMKGDIEFCLLENYQSNIKILNEAQEARWVKKFQTTYGISNQYERRNFEEGGTETVLYYTSVAGDPVKGYRYHTGDLNKIVFNNGYLIVRPGQEDLLLWLRLNERNQTNKYWEQTDTRGNQKYKPEGAFNYKEIIPEKVSEEEYNNYYQGLVAQAKVVNPESLKYDVALKMAQSYNMVDAKFKGEKAVRLFLGMKAKANPEQFMKDLTSSSFELRADINQAFMYGILAWDMPYIRWAKKMDGDQRILTVPSGKDHVDYMVHWLREIDKSGVLNQIRTEVEKAQLKEHGINLKSSEKEYDGFLKSLGVSSMEELQARLALSKDSTNSEEAPEEVKELIQNLAGYDVAMLSKVDKDKLLLIGKHFGLKGVHLYGPEKLATAILEKHKLAAVTA